jgi:regulator of replication initiation timing
MEHVLEHTSIKGLERPVDTEQLRELVGALPRLAADAQRLLQENERLSAELDKARARLDAHAGGPSAGS